MLQSSFFGGPKGKDFIISQVFPNAVTAIADIAENNSNINLGDLILIAYGPFDTPEYKQNLDIDKNNSNNNYNAKIYQKKIGKIPDKDDTIQYLYLITNTINEEQIYYEFVVDLTTDTIPVEFDFEEGTSGEKYELTTEDGRKYTLSIPAPAISYEIIEVNRPDDTGPAGEKIVNKTDLRINITTNETTTSKDIPIYETSYILPGVNKKQWNITATTNGLTNDINTKIIGEIGEGKELEELGWYFIGCTYTETDSKTSEITIFVYRYKNDKGEQLYTYSLVQGSAGSNYNYLTDQGLNITSVLENNIEGKTMIKTSDGLIYTGDAQLLPGQTMVLPSNTLEYPDGTKIHSADIITPTTPEKSLYTLSSPTERKLYNDLQNANGKISELTQKNTNLEQKVNSLLDSSVIYDTDIVDFTTSNTNFYQINVGASNSTDIFEQGKTNCINPSLMTRQQPSMENLKFNLFHLDLMNTQNNIKQYNKIKIKFKYKLKTISPPYLRYFSVSNARKECIRTTDKLNSTFQDEINIELYFSNDNYIFYNQNNIKNLGWHNTKYYDTSLSDHYYSSTSTASSFIFDNTFFGSNIFFAVITDQTNNAITTNDYLNFAEIFSWIQIQVIAENKRVAEGAGEQPDPTRVLGTLGNLDLSLASSGRTQPGETDLTILRNYLNTGTLPTGYSSIYDFNSRADINGDGVINWDDYNLLKNYIKYPSGYKYLGIAGDVYSDKSINWSDYYALLYKLDPNTYSNYSWYTMNYTGSLDFDNNGKEFNMDDITHYRNCLNSPSIYQLYTSPPQNN